jgi:hypothetical protein
MKAHRRSLPPLGLRLFVLRPGVVIDLDATDRDVAAAKVSADAWACLEAERAAAGKRRALRNRGAHGWLTLREACALIGCDEAEACERLEVRALARWKLVSVETLREYVDRHGAVSEAMYSETVNAQHSVPPDALA